MFVLKDSMSKGMDLAGDPLLMESFLHLPPLPVQDTNPTDYHWIFTKQNQSDELIQCQKSFLTDIAMKILDDKETIYYAIPGDDWEMHIFINCPHELHGSAYTTLVSCNA